MQAGVTSQGLRVGIPQAGRRIVLNFLTACGFANSLSLATACPFCTAVAPSLSQERETADVVALGEVVDAAAKPPRFRLHRVEKGDSLLADQESLSADTGQALKQGELVLLFGRRREEAMQWSTTGVNEMSAAYFFCAPAMRDPEVERIKYFAPFLEHADPTIADDAYREFGHARFDSVAKVVDQLPSGPLRAWLASDRVAEARKGFYALALGLPRGSEQDAANAAFLAKLICADQSDFRAGFDGVLGGYLLLAGSDGLKLLNERFFDNPKSAVGDVRHAMTALRFYHEYGHDIPAQRLRASLAHLLARPEFAEAAITDLARWQGWESRSQIVEIYDKPNYREPEIRRAIVGYLRACPLPDAGKDLSRLRALDPSGVASAEDELSKLGKLPQ